LTEIKVETEIAAPRDEVFSLVLDPNRLGEWVSAHRGVSEVPAGELRKGSEFRQALSLAGSPFHDRWRVAELERPSLVVWEGKGPGGSKATVRYELSENGDGTTFAYVNDYSLPGGPLGAAAGRVTSRPAQHAMNTTLRNLKRLLESSEGAKSA
jgi:uncharacterized protein YndB with AHSA1/START domain